MSQANVEVVRESFARFQSGYEVDEQFLSPDFVWDMSNFSGWPEQQTYEGPEGVRRFLAEWTGAWEDWQIEIEALHDAGEKVVAIMRRAAARRPAACRLTCPSPRSGPFATAGEPNGDVQRSRRSAQGGGPVAVAVSASHVDVVKSIFAASERGEFDTQRADPEIEFEIVHGPEPYRGTGVDAARALAQSTTASRR